MSPRIYRLTRDLPRAVWFRSLTARIEVRDDVVEWHDFRRGFREWSYEPLGRFIFDLSTYRAQFETIDWSDTGIPPGGW